MTRPRRFTYRSGLEDKVIEAARETGLPFTYEGLVLPYERPAKYKPDLILSNGIVIEIKGRFDSTDRSKHKKILETYPGIDIRFLFSKPYNTLSKRSDTTYAQWCDRMAIPWSSCDPKRPCIPHRWTTEEPERDRIEALLSCDRITEDTRRILEDGIRRLGDGSGSPL